MLLFSGLFNYSEVNFTQKVDEPKIDENKRQTYFIAVETLRSDYARLLMIFAIKVYFLCMVFESLVLCT